MPLMYEIAGGILLAVFILYMLTKPEDGPPS